MSEMPERIIETAPKRIWLCIDDEREGGGEDFPSDFEDITWSIDDATTTSVPYVRADLYAQLETKLCNLLAIIHRDGGHHITEHGLEESWKQACGKCDEWKMLPAENAALKAKLAKADGLADALEEVIKAHNDAAFVLSRSKARAALAAYKDSEL